jgi:hypothetical protein
VRADKHIWAQSYEGDIRDTLALQNKVARAIAEQIRVTLSRDEQVALEHAKAVNPEACLPAIVASTCLAWHLITPHGSSSAPHLNHSACQPD